MTVYFDGALVKTYSTNVNLSGKFTMGSRWNNVETWVGGVDHVRVFNRVLTQQGDHAARLPSERGGPARGDNPRAGGPGCPCREYLPTRYAVHVSSDDLHGWLLDPATTALAPAALLGELAGRLQTSGVSLHRISVWIPTKHPELWGHQLMWDPTSGARVVRRSHEVSTTVDYVGTPAEALHRSGAPTLRCRLERAEERGRFAMLAAMAQAGATDYVLASLDPGNAAAPSMASRALAPAASPTTRSRG